MARKKKENVPDSNECLVYKLCGEWMATYRAKYISHPLHVVLDAETPEGAVEYAKQFCHHDNIHIVECSKDIEEQALARKKFLRWREILTDACDEEQP